jgi:hypothetical protein
MDYCEGLFLLFGGLLIRDGGIGREEAFCERRRGGEGEEGRRKTLRRRARITLSL